MVTFIFPASRSSEATYAKQRKKKKDKIWWVVHMGKRERKKWWHITSPMSSIKMTNSDTCVWTLSAVNLKLSITNACLNLVILNPSLMDINY